MPTSKDRPRAWNDDVLWLLERIAGLLADQGHGTGSGSLPRGIPASDVLHYIRATHDPIDSSGEIVLQLPQTTKAWSLIAMTYDRTSGTGVTIVPRVGQSSGFVADGPDDRVSFDSQAATTRINAVFCKPIPFHVDASYRAYFRPAYNGGRDNVGTYQFWFMQGIETQESS